MVTAKVARFVWKIYDEYSTLTSDVNTCYPEHYALSKHVFGCISQGRRRVAIFHFPDKKVILNILLSQ